MSLQHAVRLQRIQESSLPHSLAPVVVPDRAHGQGMQLLGGESIVVEDGNAQSRECRSGTVAGIPVAGIPIGEFSEPEAAAFVCTPTVLRFFPVTNICAMVGMERIGVLSMPRRGRD